MYFLNEEEKLYLHKYLIPQSRDTYIDYDLRGWNWHKPPLEPIYSFKLGVAEIANNYCLTDRDLYLKKVMNKYFSANCKMLVGGIMHKTIKEFITYCKKELYHHKIDEIGKNKLFSLEETIVLRLLNSCKLDKCNEQKAKEKIISLWEFEKQRVNYRIQEVLASQPYVGIDALVYQVLPVVVEQKLNGSFLGLSPYLSTDAINFSEPMIVDTKFGRKNEFHKLSITGYAIVMEALYSFPVNLGCVVYPTFKENRILIDRELFIINDELRQKFIERRDDKMRMIYEENDPGTYEECYNDCPYYEECH